MAFSSRVVTIGTTPTQISAPSAVGKNGHTVYIQNISTTIDFYIGGSDVSTTNGYYCHRAAASYTGDDLAIKVELGEVLYAVVATGTLDQRFLYSGV
jgi:hypothetical protein